MLGMAQQRDEGQIGEPYYLKFVRDELRACQAAACESDGKHLVSQTLTGYGESGHRDLHLLSKLKKALSETQSASV